MYRKVDTNLNFVDREKEVEKFWKDNKKRVGEVCERCRDEVDDENVRRRKAVGE